MPKRCLAKARAPRDCDESSPAPGECVCNKRQCTIKPGKDRSRWPEQSSEGCERDDQCQLDRSRGRCDRVERVTASEGPVVADEPYCECDGDANRCQYQWFDSLSCKSDADCWYLRKGGRLVPFHPAKPRKLPFSPCKDGEVDVQCKQGACVITAYKC
jgi:hypothetical protein